MASVDRVRMTLAIRQEPCPVNSELLRRSSLCNFSISPQPVSGVETMIDEAFVVLGEVPNVIAW